MKYIGIVIIIIGILFIPVLVLSIINSLIRGISKNSNESSVLVGYFIGTIFMASILGWLDYLLIKFGVKLKNINKPKAINEIDSIGKNN